MSDDLAYDLESLAADVFSIVADSGRAVESLTGALGATELAASCPCSCTHIPPVLLCAGSCSAVAAD